MSLDSLLRSPTVFLVVTFFVRMALCTYLERRRPAYPLDHRAVLRGDLLSTAFLAFVTIPICDWLVYRIPNPLFRLVAPLAGVPLPLRVLLYLVLADLGHYWVHRALHTPLLWRLHKWHHAPEHMSFLAGNRESLPDRLLVSLPYIMLWPIIGPSAPAWLATALLLFAALKNDWMHLNVSLDTRRLEWFITSPRYHHIHHSDQPAHFTKNCAPLFSLWDRLFGTYVDPDSARTELTFGARPKAGLLRSIFGL